MLALEPDCLGSNPDSVLYHLWVLPKLGLCSPVLNRSTEPEFGAK